MFKPTRRGFVKAGIAASVVGMTRPVFASSEGGPDILVVVFLRGGMDGLDLLPPVSGSDRALYEQARPTLRVPLSGEGAAVTLDGGFGLHASAAPLLDLYDAGRMAIVHATGMHVPTRSHFEAQDYLELGTPGDKTVGSGWLHRHLASAWNLPGEIMVPALASGGLQPMALLGSSETLTLDDPEYFSFATGPWLWNDAQRQSLRRLYAASPSPVNVAGSQTLDSVDIVETHLTSEYSSAGDLEYPPDEVGARFALVAQMISLDLGLQVATVDVGGWDTHENQGTGPGGFFADLVSSLSSGMAAFFSDMDARGHSQRLTVVVMTEFGRRLEENADVGTDHGHAVPMMLFGKNVVGGLHGQWPGLEADQLFEGVDLAVTTDFRRVLSEVLIKRLGNRRISEVFPGFEYDSALGVVNGPDLPPVDGSPLRPTGRRVP